MVKPLMPNLRVQRRPSQPAQSFLDSTAAKDLLSYVFKAPRRTFLYVYKAGRRQLGWEEQQAQSASDVFALWAAQRAAAGLRTPLAPAAARASTAAAPALATPTKPASEAGSSASKDSGEQQLGSPASVLITPISKLAAQVHHRLLGLAHSVASEDHSMHSRAASVADSVSSHPVPPAEADEEARRAREKQRAHPAARFALRAAMAIVPIAAAAGALTAAGSSQRRRGGGSIKDGSCPSPASRSVDRERFDTPREVPWPFPKPNAYVAAH